MPSFPANYKGKKKKKKSQPELNHYIFIHIYWWLYLQYIPENKIHKNKLNKRYTHKYKNYTKYYIF